MANSVNEGGGSTDWSTMSMAQIWSVLAGYDTDPQWTHVSGWRRAYELASAHLQRMREFRAKIAVTWPPEKNEAAQAYLTRMDEMISSIQTTYDAASSNYTTVATATSAIDSTRIQLLPVYEEWRSNEEMLAGYRPAAGGTPVPAPGPPPVVPGRQEELTQQARRLMVELSGALASASYMMVTPPGYTAPRLKGDDGSDLYVRSYVPLISPVIPPAAPNPRPVAPGKQPLRRLPAGDSFNLNGERMPGHPAPPGPLTTPEKSMSSPVSIRQISGVIGSVPGVLTPGGKSSAGARPNLPAMSGSSRPSGLKPGLAAQLLPPGGVISAPPGTGLAKPGEHPIQRPNPIGGVFGGAASGDTPSTTRPGVQAAAFVGNQRAGNAPIGLATDSHRPYVKPPGSSFTGGPQAGVHHVAHPDSAGRSWTPSAIGAASEPGPAALGSFRTPDGHLVTVAGTDPGWRQREERPAGRHQDLDDPWAADKGVTPVVEAPLPLGRHDPGPAIGLNQ